MQTPSERVRLVEVGPRDGLQNEPGGLSTAGKLKMIERLSEAGVRSIEVGSFVSLRWVPAMADTAEVFRRLNRLPGVSYIGLVPNERGLQDALGADVGEIAVFAAATESFSRHNLNCSIEESLSRLAAVAKATPEHIRIRGYVSCVLGCPYEGPVDPDRVLPVAERLLELGCYEVSLGDTIGIGRPSGVGRLLELLLQRIPSDRLAVHFHDTWGQALPNILTALEHGIRTVDSSVAGLGGCPYAPGASGNVASEDVLYMLQESQFATGIDLAAVAAVGRDVCAQLKRAPASKVAAAMAAAAVRHCQI